MKRAVTEEQRSIVSQDKRISTMQLLFLIVLSSLIYVEITLADRVVFDHTFCISNNSYTGFAIHNDSICALQEILDFSSDVLSPDYALSSNFSRGYNLTVKFQHKNSTNTKIYCVTDSASRTGDCRYNIERHNTTYNHLKLDRGSFPSTGKFPINTNITVHIYVNLTSNKTSACVEGVSGCITNETFTNGGGDHIAFDTGDLTEYENWYQVKIIDLNFTEVNDFAPNVSNITWDYYFGVFSPETTYNASVQYTDADNNTGTVNIYVFKNGVLNSSSSAASVTNGSYASIVLSPAIYDKGDNITIYFNATDGIRNSPTVNSTQTVEDAPPSLVLTTNFADGAIIDYHQSPFRVNSSVTDSDLNDPINITYTWRRDGIPVQINNNATQTAPNNFSYSYSFTMFLLATKDEVNLSVGVETCSTWTNGFTAYCHSGIRYVIVTDLTPPPAPSSINTLSRNIVVGDLLQVNATFESDEYESCTDGSCQGPHANVTYPNGTTLIYAMTSVESLIWELELINGQTQANGTYNILLWNDDNNGNINTTDAGSWTVGATSNITIAGEALNNTLIAVNEHVKFNATINTTSGTITAAKVELQFPNGTLKNYTLSSTGTGGSDSNLVANHSFESSANNWTGNTSSGTDSGDGYIGAGNNGILTSPDLSLQTLRNYTLNVTMSSKDANYSKVYFASKCGTTTGPRYIWEFQSGGIYKWKHEGGGFPSVDNIPSGQKVIAQIFVDSTDQKSNSTLYNASNGVVLGTTSTQTWTSTDVGNCTRIEGGTQGSNSHFKLYHYLVWNTTGAAGDGTGISTGTWQTTISDSTSSGTHYIRKVWASSSTGETRTKQQILTFNVTALPNITIANLSLNDSFITQGEHVKIRVDVVNRTAPIDKVIATLEYPNLTLENSTLTKGTGNEYSSTWTKTSSTGTYTVKQIRANTTTGESLTETASTTFSVSSAATGTLSVSLLYPTADITVLRNKFFNVTARVSCSGGNCGNVNAYLDPLLNPSTSNSESETWEHFFEEQNGAWHRSGNVTQIEVRDGVQYTMVPWYGASDLCTTNNLNDDCSLSKYDNQNSYCVVTDEHSLFCHATAFRNDSTYEQYLAGCIRTANLARSVDYGSMSEWKFSWHDGNIDLSSVGNNDCASDGQARYIITAHLMNHNPHLSSSTKSLADSYLDSACPDFVKYIVWNDTHTIAAVQPRQVQYWMTGGCNVGTNGSVTSWGNAVYGGYIGDGIIAMLACYVHTNQTHYIDIARNFTALYLATANWSTSTGFRFVPGKEISYRTADGSGHRIPKCDNNCFGGDDADVVRAASMCTAGRIADEVIGINLTNDFAEYCTEWWDNYQTRGGITTTEYQRQIKPDGTPFIAKSDSYENNEFAGYIDNWKKQTALTDRYNKIDVKWQESPQTFNGRPCHGVYFPAHSQISLGYNLGYADPAFRVSPPSVINKELVSNTTGATPFYTNRTNPITATQDSCLSNMASGDACTIVWHVNATGPIGNTYIFNVFANSSVSATQTSSEVDIRIS